VHSFYRAAALLLTPALLAVSAARGADAIESIASALRSGRYTEAAQLAGQALQSDPKNNRLLTLRGLALSKTGDAAQALNSFKSALNAAHGYVPALEGAAELEFKSGDRAAVAHLDELLKLRPGDGTAHAMRAVIAWKEHDCKLAVEHFAAAPGPIASQPSALYEYGSCLAQLKENGEAIRVFQQLHRLTPEDHRPAYALASLQMSEGQYQNAIDTHQLILSGGNIDADGLQIASAAYESLGDTPQAAKTLRQAIVMAPDQADLYVQFASLCLEHKSFRVGIDMINAGLARLPGSAKLYLARGVMYVQEGNYDAADKDFARAETLDAPESSGAGAKALSEVQANHLDDALRTVDMQIKWHPNDAFFHYLLAEILAKRGAQPGSPDFARAIAAGERAVQLKPDFNLARDVLSRLYLESGKTQLAIEQCRRALAIDPKDETALYRLIRALKASGTKSDSSEIPALLRRLADARRLAQKREGEASRYRLVEEMPSASPGAHTN